MQKRLITSWLSLASAICMAVTFSFVSCNDDEDDPIPAVADFTFVATEGTGSVAFTNTSTNGLQYSWDFGDATPASTETSPTHVYTTSGTYTVKLTALGTPGTTPSVKQQQVAVTRTAPNLVQGGSFETGDAAKWTIVGTGADLLPKVEFGATTNVPQGGLGGALKISNPDGLKTGDKVEMVMYRSIELVAGKTYSISALINHGPLSATDVSDGGPKEAFLSIEIANAAPNGTGQWKTSDNKDSYVLLHRYCVCWMGASSPSVNGAWVNSYTANWINYLTGNAAVLDFTVETSGTYYVGFKAGLGIASGATFSNNGFVVDNLVISEK